MKKCPGCEKELDKYLIACEYCGSLADYSKKKSAQAKKEVLSKNAKKVKQKNKK